MNENKIITQQSQILSRYGMNKIYQVDYLSSEIITIPSQQISGIIQTKQQQKMRQYLQDSAKDMNRYYDAKSNLTAKYFKVQNNNRKHIYPINIPEKINNSISSVKKQGQKFTLSDSYHRDYSKEIKKLLSESLKLKQVAKKRNFRSRSEKEKKHQKLVKEERKEIIDLINHNVMNQFPYIRNHQHSNREKYSLNYMNYLQIKTKYSIDKQFYEKNVRKKQSMMDKFQQFILKQVKFSKEDRNKLENFFMKIRQQFQNIEKRYHKLSFQQ